MPERLIITVTEEDGGDYRIESEIRATTVGSVCAMAAGVVDEIKRLHDEARYLHDVRN
jgi:hypothetical protein